MQEFDVAVVGAGPIGGYVAQKIAEKNYNVALFEKNKQIGLPLNCAGLVSQRVFDCLNISTKNIVQNKIKGANIYSPSGKTLNIGGDKIHGLVIDRVNFDQEIIKQAKQEGSDLFLDHRISKVKKSKDFVKLKTSNNDEIKCKLLIGADGPKSKIRKEFLLPEPVEYLKGIGAEIMDANLDPNFVNIFVGSKVAPGFFAWIIPINSKGTKARIGLCIDDSKNKPPKYYLDKLFTNKVSKDFLDGTTITKPIGGVIPIGPLKKSYDSNVMLVGDAAAQVKPTSGGGIFPGLLCGKYCSEFAISGLSNNDLSQNFLKNYHKQWYGDIGKELNKGMMFRRIFKRLSDRQFDKYIDKFSEPKIVEIISKNGDIDYPSKLVRPLLKKLPTLIRFATSRIK